MVLIAIWPVQKSENAVHLTGHKDSGTKQILREKWCPPGRVLRDQIPGFFCPVGTYGMYVISVNLFMVLLES